MKKTNISIIAAALLLTLGIANFAGIAKAQPNVLFIAVNDLKPLRGCYGDEMAITPNIDSLADSGVTFLNAHCRWSICGASRASLTTSLMPEETGVFFFQALRYVLPDLIT
ncbi:MAG: sulfatase-like hydrolase/transferase, partial [Planctomycetes bacterium]|nr:sulfatase-like hydrolase/transferase [Planctomycetota bacterium]